jgi:hypothetical protein
MTIRHDRRNGRAWRLPAALVAGALLLFAPQGTHAETAPPLRAGTVVGRVTDARTGQPLGGTTVEVSGTVLQAATDADGRYRLVNVPNGAQIILARRIGYAAIRQAVTVTEGQQATADFALEAAPFSLDEIVITGTAGGELRRTLGNSVSSIAAGEALERSAAPNLSALLNARSPGTIVTPGTGRTGAGSTIQIRGRSTLSLSSEPIVYIDGVRVNNAVGQGPSGAGASSFGSRTRRSPRGSTTSTPTTSRASKSSRDRPRRRSTALKRPTASSRSSPRRGATVRRGGPPASSRARPISPTPKDGFRRTFGAMPQARWWRGTATSRKPTAAGLSTAPGTPSRTISPCPAAAKT